MQAPATSPIGRSPALQRRADAPHGPATAARPILRSSAPLRSGGPRFLSRQRWMRSRPPAAGGSDPQTLRLRGDDFDFRVIALGGLFVLAVFYTLFLAKSFFLPLVLAALLSLALRAPVRRLMRLGLPEGLAAALVLLGLLGLAGFTAVQLRGPALEWFTDMPKTLHRLDRKIVELRKPVEEVSRAAAEVQKITKMNDGAPAARAVEIKEPSPMDSFVSGAGGFLAAGFVSVVLLYLFLVFGDDFLTRLIRMLPSVESTDEAAQVSLSLERHVSSYLASISVINAGLGVIVGLAMWLLDMPNPWLWGAIAGALNFIPYVGAIITTGVIGLVALVTFPELKQALLPPIIFLVINSIEAMLVTPILLGRRFALNPLVVFSWLFLWGWLWGIGGALLAIPMLTTVKILCDHIEPLGRLGELLGEDSSASTTAKASDDEDEVASASAEVSAEPAA